MPGPTFTVPDPPSGYQGTPQTEQENQEALFFGEDIFFDVSAQDETGHASYVVNAAGDWTSASGETALRQSLFRRLITSPDEWKTKPGYGCGARQYIKARNTEANRAELASRIKSQFALDKRVHSVNTVIVARLDDGSDGIKIQVSVIPVGRLRLNKQTTFSWELR